MDEANHRNHPYVLKADEGWTYRYGVDFTVKSSEIQKGIQHGYTIRGTDPVRLIVVTSPVRDEVTGGWQGFVGDMESGQGKMITKPPNIGGKYGIKIYRDSHR